MNPIIVTENMKHEKDNKLRKSNEIWLRNLNAYSDYVNENNKLPEQGSKEYGWMRNQKNSYKKGELNSERVYLLNNLLPFWNSSLTITDINNKLLLNSDWRSKVKNVPVDEVLDDEDKLYWCLTHDIFDAEDLINSLLDDNINHSYNKRVLSDSAIYKAYLVLLPNLIDESCLIFLCHIFNHKIYKSSISDTKQFILSFNFLSEKETQVKIMKMISTLSEREATIIKYYYGIDSDIQINSYIELGEFLNMTSQRVQQIMAKALRKLRHPSRTIYLHETNDYLDDLDLDEDIKSSLYQLEIDTKKKMRLLLNSNLLSESVRDHINECIFNHNVTVNMNRENLSEYSLEELNLSLRSYNCLRRAQISNLQELKEFLEKDNEEILKVRDLGIKSLNEIRDKYKTFSRILTSSKIIEEF